MAIIKLDTRRQLKNGKYPIVIYIGAGTTINIATNFSCSLDEWDGQRYVGANAKSINLVLSSQLNQVNARFDELRRMGYVGTTTHKQLRAMILDTSLSAPPTPAPPKLGEVFEKVIKIKGGSNGRIIADTLKKLASYCDPYKVEFSQISRVWLDEWLADQSMYKLAPNTKSIHLRNLRTVVNYAIDMGVTDTYAFRRYKIPKGVVRKKDLGVDVLRELMRADLPKWQQKYRDLFMLIFYLCGINIADLCALKRITREGRIEYDRAKTHRHYSIKVEPEALAIIESMRGTNHLLDILDSHKNYRIFYNTLCNGLRGIRDVLGIDELTTYWARHTWASIAASLDIPKETIAAALGHGGHTVTDIYIDFDRRKIDEANRRVIDWVLYGKK